MRMSPAKPAKGGGRLGDRHVSFRRRSQYRRRLTLVNLANKTGHLMFACACRFATCICPGTSRAEPTRVYLTMDI